MTAGQLSIDLPAVAANCYRCASRFQDDIVALRGIDSVEVDARSRKVTITYEPEKVDLETIDRVGTNAEAKLERTYRHAIYSFEGWTAKTAPQRLAPA